VQPLLHELILAASAECPSAVAVESDDGVISYAEFAARASALARYLLHRGLAPGERVAIVSGNSPEYLIIAMGVWRAGGILATIYASTGTLEQEFVLRTAEPKFIFVDEVHVPIVARALHATSVDATLLPISALSTLVVADGGPTLPRVEAESAAVICYTSGTSTHPKPVVHSHAALVAAVRTYAATWHFRASDRVILCVPLAWLFGLITVGWCTLATGGTVLLMRKFDAQQVLGTLARKHATVLPGVTTMFVKLVGAARELYAAEDFTSLRFCLSGGEPRNEGAFAEWKRITGRPVYDVYGSSECFPFATYDPYEDAEPRPGSAGKLVAGAELRLVKSDGSIAGIGEVGEALTRGFALMLGYWRDPELTRSALTEDGWFRTRDLLKRDADGYVYVVGRASDLIIRGGSNVSPGEVEAALAEHPSVLQVAVTGLPDPDYGQRVAAAVVLAPGAMFDAQILQDFCAARLARYKIPSLLRPIDALPLNQAGKVDRREVARWFAADGSEPG